MFYFIWIMNKKTHVLQYSLHQCNRHFRLLHKVVLRILHLKTGMLLFSWIGVLQAIRIDKSGPPLFEE